MGSNNKSDLKNGNNGLRVVVADDFRPMLDTIVGLLAPHCEVVGTAADGRAALETIVRLKPDVAVLDVSMPHKTGIEVADELKTSAPNVKVVIVSAHSDESYVRAARSAGASEYVVKATMADGLVPALKRAHAENVPV